MSRCELPEERLMAWLDGETGADDRGVRQHVETCPECAAQMAKWRRASRELGEMVDQGLGEVDPLVALRGIRRRIAEAEQQSLMGRLRQAWQDLWLLHRRAIAGLAVAAALGAMAAPIAVYVAGRALDLSQASHGPAVVVESLEVGGNATAVVLGGNGDTTTLIWVEPNADATELEDTY